MQAIDVNNTLKEFKSKNQEQACDTQHRSNYTSRVKNTTFI